MKKLWTFLLVFSSLSITCLAQSWKYQKLPSLGVHFFYNDFKTAQHIRASSFKQAVHDGKFGRLKDMDAGLAVSYMQGLNNHLDFSTTLSASFLDYPSKGISVLGENKLLLEWDAMVYAKMLSDKHLVSPYLSAGIGVSKYNGYYGAFFPIGMGAQFKVINKAFILINAQYRFKVTNNTTDHFYYSAGIAGNIVRKRKKIVKKIIEPLIVSKERPLFVDKHNDGILDKDNDGILDKDDQCPEVPGTAENKGCPVITISREIASQLEYAARNIFFATGSAELLKVSEDPLTIVSNLLLNLPTLKLAIEGHTDDVGKPEDNLILSDKRANSVKNYLAKKGVDTLRLTAIGYGQNKPIADNSTPEGRAKNRRVEFKLKK